ncbi:hypothetical protein [Aeromonas caviae]|uniref:hypothetical protein n=1 Tax=Aeromonas caviae TaxID=648 RepID=UPI0025B634EA|nr:hypothetical protein [Aeromonas caviae]
MLLVANPRKTEAENGVSDDILRGNFKNAAENWSRKKSGASQPNASQLSLTGIVFTRFSRRILLWFGFDAPWVTSFSAGG